MFACESYIVICTSSSLGIFSGASSDIPFAGRTLCYNSGNLLYDSAPLGDILLYLGIFCRTTSRYSASAYRLVLVNVWAELCPRRCPPYSLEFSPFLSTHLRSINKKLVNCKQRALPITDIPVPLTSLCLCTPLHIWRRRQDWSPLN